MDIVAFISTYHHQPIDYDRAFGYTCVDLFRLYCERVLQVPQPEGVKGALEFVKRYNEMPTLSKHFTVESVGTTGDFAVWGATKNNPYGHIALVVGAVDQTAIVFEQDGYKQIPASFGFHTMENCIGFLRRKPIPS